MSGLGTEESDGEVWVSEERDRRLDEATGKVESVLLSEISEAERLRIEAIVTLAKGVTGRETERSMERVAEQLGLSESSVKRLMRRWQAQGIIGLVRQLRSDRGEHRISMEWQEYILKTYRSGNRSGRKMSPAQVFVRVAARAAENGEEEYPSRSTVYRVLRGQVQERQGTKRSLGWRGEQLALKSRSGEALGVSYSNQIWQADHTRVDVLVVDQSGAVLGRPWLSLVVDSYSRCVMGLHLGMEAPSAAVVCLALRHAILPKQYSSSYGLSQSWSSYGIPQCLYSDNGKDFKSQHIEQVALELGIKCEQRRYPSEGGIVERPFGTFNSEVFSTLPGYTGSNVSQRPKQAETSASLTLIELEKLLVRYIVDRYNQSLDARSGKQTRQGRWEAGCITLPVVVGERDLDICLMRQERRSVYRGGYIQYANLTYRGEHLGGYAGESVTIRYNPRDITSILIYQRNGVKETFLTRAHAQGLETECLSLAEAQAISRRVRAAGRIVSNQSVLSEVRRRDAEVSQLRRGRKPNPIPTPVAPQPPERQNQEPAPQQTPIPPTDKAEPGDDRDLLIRPVPHTVVRDYEEWKQEYGLW